MPKLVVLSGADVKEVAIKSELSIGRSSSNDLPLNEENASRQHAKVVYKDKKAKLIDLDSSNGTRVNGMKVKEKELAHGDTITIGKSSVIYQDDGDLNREGSVIGGYKLTQKLGEGGMGTVFRATQLSMDRSVALKILKKELCDSREFVKGFLREARLAGQLNHAGIIQVHEVNQHKEVIYFSMEFVEGKTAQDLVDKEGKVRLHQALDIVMAVADALAYADSKGIIHRDIKPANIIVTKTNDYKLADLGLAGGGAAQANKDKKSARVMGTPNYIAPEQSENKELDIRADIYALGATFYHLLTGHPPFSGPNAIAIITMHHTEPRPKVRKEVPTCPKSVEELIEKMMAIDKKDRPANAKDLLEALREIKQKEQTAIRKSLPKSAQQEPVNTARTTIREEVEEEEGEEETGEARKASSTSRRMVKEGGGTRGKSMTAVHKPAGGGDGLNSILSLLNVLAFLTLAAAVGVWAYGPEKLFPKTFEAEEQAARDLHAKKKREAMEWNLEQRKARDEYIQRMREAASHGGGIDPGTNPGTTVQGPPDPIKPPVGPGDPPVNTNPPPTVDKTPEQILIATNETCTKAQKKFDKNDWVSARRMLNEHLQEYGKIEQTRLAVDLLGEVNTRIDIYLNTCLKNVKEKSDAHDFAGAARWGSQAIALDPTSRQGLEIQVILGNNDLLMQSACEKAVRDGREQINNGDFQTAAKDLTAILNRANGTSWTAKLRSLHLEALYGDRISKKLNKVLVDAWKNETPFVMTARGTDTGYSVAKLAGFKVTCADGPVMKISNFSDDTMHNWISKIPNLDAIDHLALGIFLDLAGVNTVAAEEIQKAARDRMTAADAIAYQTSHNMIKNFRYYDFTDWKQQLDWQVQAGSWAFQDERFECTSEDLGEIGIDPAKAELAAANLSLSWVVYPKDDKAGFQVDLFQDTQHRLAVACEDGKVRLEAQVGEATQKQEAVQVISKDKPVEFLIEVRGDTVTLKLPAPAKPIKVNLNGADGLKGKLRIQILSGTSAFDDILVQN